MSARLFVWFHVSLMLAAVGSTIAIAIAEPPPAVVPARAVPPPEPKVTVFLRRGPHDVAVWDAGAAARPGDRLRISVADPERRHATVLVPDARGFPVALGATRLETTSAAMLPVRWTIPAPPVPPITVALSERPLTLPQMQRLVRGEDAARVWTRTLVLDRPRPAAQKSL